MKSKIKATVVLGALLFGMFATSGSAFTPSGWVYMGYPYIYNQTYTEWHYINQSDSAWVCNMTTGGSWYKLNNSTLSGPGWAYWKWPWVYCSANACWYWIPSDSANTTWVCNMGSGQWTKLGAIEAHSGAVQFTLTWDAPVDLDLHVSEPGGETIYYSHKTSVSGGSLDVDDVDGYGPENVFWPSGGAPHGIYQPSIYYYSNRSYAGAVNFVLKIKRTGYAEATFTGNFTDSSKVGLSKLSPSYTY